MDMKDKVDMDSKELLAIGSEQFLKKMDSKTLSINIWIYLNSFISFISFDVSLSAHVSFNILVHKEDIDVLTMKPLCFDKDY